MIRVYPFWSGCALVGPILVRPSDDSRIPDMCIFLSFLLRNLLGCQCILDIKPVGWTGGPFSVLCVWLPPAPLGLVRVLAQDGW